MPRKPKNDISGWVNLDKPVGISSNDALSVVKKALNFPKIGHAGTLDPLASGILPIALGEATKLVPYMMDDDKTYIFTVTWGEGRNTDDAEGEVIATSPVRPTEDQIKAALPDFTGTIDQIPPAFSAIKVEGKRAYDLARAGEDVELKARPVEIYELILTETTTDTATFRCVCGKGTYVRSLARDLAEKLGTKGYISCLMRDQVGPFYGKNAISLDFFRETSDKATLESIVLPVEAVLDDVPVVPLTDSEATRIGNGNKITLIARPDVERLVKAGLSPQARTLELALLTHRGKPVAVADVEGTEIQPVRVFNL
ncbi:MAG TPA: tRNA pseudouridine(55) synthase TruB [Alphaproteobacteria bacterium]|nr:tRNA pseudouridine(55) synthase TruB [Alphaproteobacteria bacterium]HNS44552.1 tRNA pseudouridine(55) synthase TruB [Alphaproteobacteria bacterium]